MLSSLRANNGFKSKLRNKIVRCPKGTGKCKCSARLSQTEMQSQLCKEKSAVCSITYFLFSFDHGMLVVSQNSCWLALLMVSSSRSRQGALSDSDSAWPGQGLHLHCCGRLKGFIPVPGRREEALLLWFGGDFLPLCLGARNQEGTVLEWGKPADFSSGSLQHESDVSTSANAQCAAYQPVRQCWLIAGNAHRMPGISQGALQWYFKNKRWLACDKYFYRSGNDKIQGIPKEQTGSLWCWTNRN